MILKFAFRNIFRNKKRTIVSALSVFFGALFVGLAYGYVNGMMDMMLSSFVRYQTGHVRVTTEEFIGREKFMPVDELVPGSNNLIQDIEKVEGVESVEKRIKFGILLFKDNAPVPVLGVAVDIDNNKLNLREKVIEGSLDEPGIYISNRLAEKLDKKLGDDLLIATQTSMGGLNGLKLPIKAIIETKVIDYDERFLYLPMKEAERLLKLGGNATEILVYGNTDEEATKEVKEKISLMLQDGVTAKTYIEQMGGLYGYIDTAKMIYLVIEFAILFLACIVIINTMLMAIFERMREIGTMKALGFSEKQLFRMFTTEGALIGVIGGIPGVIIGWLLIYVLSITGIDLGDAMKGVGYPMEYILYPHVNPTDLIAVIFLALIVPILASMLPSRYIKRYLPADALRM
ncbi:MAG: FtsX-like permease family protein [Leptospirales bacterium]